ncbi:hypothetical protein NTGM5_480044 [Candidatus Nitrotoga sp. M5]|nr:hypothetical protein NTGM5_480044 [Candidatus Nitrotoga sp. M5]
MLLTIHRSDTTIYAMKLNEYLITTSQAKLGSLLNVSQSVVSQWVRGETRITAERAIQIEKVTKGQVSREELRPDLYERNMPVI